MAYRFEYELGARSTPRSSSLEERTPDLRSSTRTPSAPPPRYSQISSRSTGTRPRIPRVIQNLTYQHTAQADSNVQPEIVALAFYLDDAETVCDQVELELDQSPSNSQLKVMCSMTTDALNRITDTERAAISLPTAIDHLRRSADLKSRCRTLIYRSSNIVSSTSSDDKPHQYLEKTKLKKFTGIISDWPSFWQLFEALIHSRSDIEPIIKFNYLRNYLSGEPEELIRSLRLTAENYQPAVQLLLNRYGDSGKLRKLYVKKLEKLRTPKYELSSLKTFSASIRCIFAELRSIYNPPDSVDYISTSLTSKLPRKIYSQLASDAKKFEFTIPEILDAIDLHINLLEYLDLSEDEDTKPKKHVDAPPSKVTSFKDSQSKSFSNSKTSFVSKPKSVVTCPLCNQISVKPSVLTMHRGPGYLLGL